MLDSRIKELPEFVINQIKAGEVIERPSQLLKEIIENSIDALSKNIEIKIRNNGLDLIQISDDGIGMEFEELPLAFKRHATSKINQFSDIYEIYSYGFRGEALASISAVSKVHCRSSSRDNPNGGEIFLQAGEIISHEKYRKDYPGTTLSIENLFFNTPVRLKFLKSLNAEKKAIQNILQSFLISWPQVRFSIQWDDEEPQTYPATSNQEERIARVMFKKKQSQDAIIKIEDELGDIQIKGFISPFSSKGGGKKQYLFVNGRLFIEKPLHYFITRQLEPVWGGGQSGHYIIFISIPSDQIDVNIHPSKTQIKFEDDSIIFSLISKSLKGVIHQINPEENLQKPLGTNVVESEAGLNRSQPSSFRNTQFGQFKNPNAEVENSQIKEVDSNYFSHRIEEKTFLVSKTKFLNLYLGKFCLSNESKSIPLIISDPFHRVDFKDKDIEYFQNTLNIELEFLDHELMVLRSIPDNLSKLPYKKVIESYLQCYRATGQVSAENLQLNHVIQDFVPHQYKAIIEDRKINLIDHDFAREINEELFEK